MAEKNEPETQLKKHPDELVAEVQRLLRANGYVLNSLSFEGKRGGAHIYG